MSTEQYSVLGEAPDSLKLQKLSSNDFHLSIENLNAGYGKMEILHDLNLYISKGQSLCLIGPNGAGKSTILHSIYGFTNIFSGQIKFDGKDITNLTPAEKLKTVGIAYILQDNSVFPDMTVEENLLMGGYIKKTTEESYEETEKILEKYGSIFDNHIPCVYAVKLPDKEIKVGDGLYEMLEKNGVPGKTSANDPLIKYDIPKESIVARIDLSKEIKHWRKANTFNIPKPVPWD